MIESTQNSLQSTTLQPQKRRVLTMIKNERMGGYVPKWETITVTPENPKQEVEQKLAQAQQDPTKTKTPEIANAYAPSDGSTTSNPAAEDQFNFGDLVDMVNPLQHIPVVGQVYRGVTGDEIKPISKIVGGTLFGGPIGAAVGLVNAVSVAETGKDVADNAIAAFKGEKVAFKSEVAQKISDEPAPQVQADIEIAKTPEPIVHDEPENTTIAVADLTQAAIMLQSQSKSSIDDYPFMPKGPLTDLFTNSKPQPIGALKDNQE